MAKKKDQKEGASSEAPLFQPGFFSAARRRVAATKAYYSGELEEIRRRDIEMGAPCWRIIRYERVCNPDDNPIPLSVNSFVLPQTLQIHLQHLSKHCRVMALPELIRRIDEYEEIPDKTVAITFDGGHSDNYLHAFPLLAKMGLTATFFLPTGYIGTDRFFFEDGVALLLSGMRARGLKLPLWDFLPDEMTEAVKEQSPDLEINDAAINLFIKGLRLLPLEDQEKAAAAAAVEVDRIGTLPEFEDFMRWDDVRQLKKAGMSLGLAGHSYLPATTIGPEELVADIMRSVDILQEQEIEAERIYALPYGLFSTEVLTMLRRMGMRYTAAIGSIPEPRFQTELPMLLGRIPMSEPTSFAKEIFACRLWGLTVSKMTF